MQIKSLQIDRRILEGFRRKAKKQYPREYMEAMFGKVTLEGEVLIYGFCAIPHVGSKEFCQFDPSDYVSLEEDANVLGLHLVGTIHSHCTMNTCTHPSELDHTTGVEHGEFVMGVMHVFRQNGVLRTRCSFNVPRKPLEVRVS